MLAWESGTKVDFSSHYLRSEVPEVQKPSVLPEGKGLLPEGKGLLPEGKGLLPEGKGLLPEGKGLWHTRSMNR